MTADGVTSGPISRDAGGPVVLDGRLGPPPFAAPLIERPRLIEALGRLTQRFVVLEAPPGFGKTALLSQWLARDSGAGTIWLTLEVGDDPATIVDHLAAGFIRAGLARADDRPIEAGEPMARLRALLAAVEQSDRSWFLVLDNIERAGEQVRRALIEPLVRMAPEGLGLVLACSQRLSLDLSDPDARGLIAWVGPDDLRFTAEEIRALCGRSVTAYRLRQIQQRTLGWPLLVRIMASADTPAPPIRGRSADRALEDFLDYRLLAQLEPDAAHDCAMLAVLERFDEGLVEHLLGRRWAREGLDRLKALGLVDAAPTEEGMHLAFNPLLRDRLRRLAERRTPEELDRFSRRAVEALSAAGRHVNAARLAVDLGDEALIVKVVEACDPARMMFGEGVGSLRKILRLIPKDLQRRQPRIGYARIICWIKSGDLADAVELFDTLETLLRTSAVPLSEWPGLARLDRQLCRLMIATYVGLPLTIADIEEQRRLAELDEALAPMIESMTDTLLCYVLQREGRFEEAKAAAQRAILHANHVGSSYAALFMYCDIAMILGIQGRVAEAQETFQAGERACIDVLRQDERLAMIRDVTRLELQHELEPDDMSQAERLRTICRRLPRLEGWPDVFAAAYRTYSEKLAISGDLDAALAVVQTGLDFAASQGIAPLTVMLTAQRVILLAWSRRLEEARAVLAELCGEMPPASPPSWREQEAVAEALAALDLVEGTTGAVGRLQAALAASRRTGARRSADRFQAWLERLGQDGDAQGASPFRRTPRLIGALLAWRGLKPGAAAAGVRRPELFTAHERRVLDRLGQGMSDKAIGLELGISPHGVRYHLKRIYAQLNVSTRRQAWDRARALGFGAPPTTCLPPPTTHLR